MPPPLDLSRRNFGRLTVIARGPRVRWGRMQSSWLCRCECGVELAVPQNRLPHRASIPAGHVVDACPDCRAKPCLVCGAPIPPTSSAKTCSGSCRRERERQYQIDYYHTVRVPDPEDTDRRRERGRRRWEQMTEEERAAAGKAKYERVLRTRGRAELNRIARDEHARRMNDPVARARHRQKVARWVAENPESARRAQREAARRKRARTVEQQMRAIIEKAEAMDELD